ncbi:muconate cycloisomerase, partial [Acinetobacter baumannii]|uniref:enolase C-terminal domain-like protein n=1 Tax=Acinetobacter baumannii TaxID=470 RepID=UPI0010F30A3F
VIALKKAFGADVSVRVDVNRARSELECIHGIQKHQDGGIDLIEQPCAIQNTEALARLTQRFDVAIMCVEALTGPYSSYR